MKKYLLILINVFVINSQSLKKLDDYSNKFFETKDIQEKLEYANTFMNIAKQENNKMHIAFGYYLFANLYIDTDVNKALFYFDKVVENSKYQNHPAFPMVVYCEKAELLHKLNRIGESMKTYNEGLAYCREIKNEYEDVIKLSIAITKSEELGETKEALKVYKACFMNFKKNKKFPYYYLKSIFSIADAYKTLKKSDLATYYNELGYKEAIKNHHDSYKALFVLNEGANLINKRQYRAALDSINKIKSTIYVLLDNTLNPLACHFYSGKAYQGLGEYENALVEYKKIDSFYQTNKRITPEFIEGYSFLISYYNKKGDFRNELKYLKIYNSIEGNFIKKYKNLYKNIKEKYEIPELIRGKENENYFLKSFIYIICPILFLAILYIIYVKFKISRNKKIFDEILKNIASNELLNESGLLNNEIQNTTHKKSDVLKSSEINSKVVDMILDNLIEFENKKGFLKKSITSQSLANDFNTNSKYISKIINDYKNSKVNEYINVLRIEYAILTLRNDKKTRKYSLEALANEFGFNNVESFNAAFYKKTGIKTSYFIKELDKNKI